MGSPPYQSWYNHAITPSTPVTTKLPMTKATCMQTCARWVSNNVSQHEQNTLKLFGGAFKLARTRCQFKCQNVYRTTLGDGFGIFCRWICSFRTSHAFGTAARYASCGFNTDSNWVSGTSSVCALAQRMCFNSSVWHKVELKQDKTPMSISERCEWPTKYRWEYNGSSVNTKLNTTSMGQGTSVWDSRKSLIGFSIKAEFRSKFIIHAEFWIYNRL